MNIQDLTAKVVKIFLLIILVKKDVGYFKKTLDCKPNLQVTKKYVVHLIVIRKNAGCGYYGPEMKMKRWKASLPHYSNLLDTDLVSGAISCYRDNEEKEYWIGSFAVIDIDSIR